MLEAGVGLHKALEVLCDGAEDEVTEVVLHRLLKAVEMGRNLSSAMSSFPRVFGQVFLAMVEVGEETGQLARTLSNVANWLETEEALIRQVRSALTYPTLVLSITTVLTWAFFVGIFPAFADSQQSVVGKLPAVTAVMVKISEALRSPMFTTLAIVAFVGALYFAGQSLKVPKNRLAAWKLLARLPVMNGLLRDYGASRFASAMAILLETGVDILKSFRLSSLASGSPMVMSHVDKGLLYLSHGGDLSAFMKDHPEAYPSMMAGLVMVGQESAQMPEMFHKLQRTLGEDTEHRLEVLTTMLEPILMAIVAVLVGLLVLGVVMPMYGLVNTAL